MISTRRKKQITFYYFFIFWNFPRRKDNINISIQVKEMDDEEYSYQALQEPLYRVETGNYEYRWVMAGWWVVGDV